MTDATSGLVALLGAALGFGGKWATEWLGDRRRERREREARQDARREFLQQRRSDFQRQNLLDLQEAAMTLMRSAGRVHLADVIAYNKSGEWRAHLLPEGLSDEAALAQRATTTLMVRIEDSEVRTLTDSLKHHAGNLAMSPNRAEADRSLNEATYAHDALNKRIGEVLRALDRDPDGAAMP